MPIPLVTSVRPVASDDLLEALRGASIVDEHRALMGTVIEKGLVCQKWADRILH